MINVANLGEKWTPRRLTNLRLWLDASDASSFRDASNGEISDGENVSKWFCSQFGYEFNDQSTSSKQPVWNLSGFGDKSKPYVQFDGTTDILKCTDTNLLTALNGDSYGTIIVVGSNSNDSSTNTLSYFINSGDSAGGSNNIGLRSRVISQSNYNGITNNQSGVNNQVRQTQGVTGGANDEVYYILGSDGSAYKLRTITNFLGADQNWSGKTTETGTDDGDWFADIANRDNVCVGGYIVNGTTDPDKCRIAEIIITGEDILADATTLDYLDRYLKRKYGNYTS